MVREIKKPSKNNDSKIPNSATQAKKSFDDEKAKLIFSKACETHCQLSEWHRDELNALINCFKKLESMQWKDIKKDSGFDYETVKYICLQRPKTLPPDASLDSLRVSGKSRLYGYRTQEFFNIIWFDKNHIVCAMDKQKKYSV